MLLQRWILVASIIGFIPGIAYSADGDVTSGETIYLKRCVGCHGVDGDGLGAGNERLVPPPRDFTSGMFKFMSTAFDGYIPQDDDIYEMIDKGMPGTAMPGWQDILSVQEMWDLVAYIKVFPGYDVEEAGPGVDYGKAIPTSEESIKTGRELFLEEDRCSECHGQEGKGDAIKRLLGDNGERTWPRNLTKPWTFRHSNDPRDIFTRISVGIPGTQMPSFADPASKKILSVEERWHVANYVNSLAKSIEVVNTENTVVKSTRVEQSVPDNPLDDIWSDVLPSTFLLVPQIIGSDRHFTPSNDTITVRSLFSADELAILVEWDDRTKSLPGDDDAEKIAEPADLAEDVVAIQLPVNLPDGMEKPYFAMGDKKWPVSLWQWRSGTTTQTQSATLLEATGFNTAVSQPGGELSANGVYDAGTWKVLFKKKIAGDDNLIFKEGVFVPLAFSVWDGSNDESGTKHTLTTWYWLLLEPASSTLPFVGGFIALLIVIGLELLWLRTSSRRRVQRA
jgi:DMSO reductase family type II enzyme heme b subunit